MTEIKKKKKINNLTLQECESILNRLNALPNQKENKYYQDILNQFNKLKK